MSRYRLLIAFGSNVGHREQNLSCAFDYVSLYSKVFRSSSWRITKPLTHPAYEISEHADYLNFVAEVFTDFDPFEFYKQIIVKIEDKLGHNRVIKWAPRALDIDVIFAVINDADDFWECTPITINRDNFFVPHLEYGKRHFWQEMIAEMEEKSYNGISGSKR